MIGGFFRKKKQGDSSWLNTDLLMKAWQMAMVLLEGDSERAFSVTLESIDKVDTYNPTLRYYKLRSRDYRSKVEFDKAMLLQYFVYEVAQKYELEQEKDYLAGKRSLNEETMIARYINHLLYVSITNRSFSVTVALCRLLYNYKQSHTSRIYHAVIQYVGPNKSDEQFHGRKRTLTDSIIKRFPHFLTVLEASKQRKRFQVYEDQGRIANYVKQCLNLFTPWNSPCIESLAFNGGLLEIPHLRFSKSPKIKNADAEHQVEKARIHTLIDPNCFSQITEALGLSSPDEKLAMPKFFIPNDDTPQSSIPPIDLSNPPEPGREELKRLTDAVLRQRHRRQESSPGELVIFIDRINRGGMALEQTSSTQIELKKGDDLIEVYSKENNGNILLSTSSLRLNRILGYEDCLESCMKLERGQKIGLSVSVNESDDPYKALTSMLKVTYSESNLIRAIPFWSKRLKYKLLQLPVNGKKCGEVLVWMKSLINNSHQNEPADKMDFVRTPRVLYLTRKRLALVLLLFAITISIPPRNRTNVPSDYLPQAHEAGKTASPLPTGNHCHSSSYRPKFLENVPSSDMALSKRNSSAADSDNHSEENKGNIAKNGERNPLLLLVPEKTLVNNPYTQQNDSKDKSENLTLTARDSDKKPANDPVPENPLPPKPRDDGGPGQQHISMDKPRKDDSENHLHDHKGS